MKPFLNKTSLMAASFYAVAMAVTPVNFSGTVPHLLAEELDVEKDELKFGFIKLTDMAPLAVAYELGYFEEEGLFVTLEPQANWKVLLDRVIDGELDGAHMLAGQPLGATIGFGTKAMRSSPFNWNNWIKVSLIMCCNMNPMTSFLLGRWAL